MSDHRPSPLRYPGGKNFLTQFLAEAIRINNAADGIYVEPCAGGGGAALRLLFEEHVSFIHLNDADPCIYAFWKGVTRHTDSFLKLLTDTPVNVRTWKRQREIIRRPKEHPQLQLGFATFYLNRCNRSGALNAGPIGGLKQTGNYLIDVRFNKPQLRKKIEKIGLYRDRISTSCHDAVTLLQSHEPRNAWESDKTIVYLDPPYYGKGKRLYRKFFTDADHARLALYLNANCRFRWIVSYDDVPSIRKLYSGEKNVIFMNYFMHTVRIGRELILASANCELPTQYFATEEEVIAKRMSG